MIEIREKEIFQILESCHEDIEDYESNEVLKMSEKPMGFLADHYILRVYFKSIQTKDFFLKAVPVDIGKRVEYLNEAGFFSRETQVYQILIPKLLSCSSLSWAPKCFFAKDGHYIVMEILNDFKTHSTQDLVFDFDHLKVAAVTLAVLHSSSIIFEEKSGKKIVQAHKEMLEENAYPKIQGHVRQIGLEKAIEVLSELVKNIPEYRDSANLESILEEFPDTIRRIYDFVQSSNKYKNVFLHGDLWVNNCMFKYEDNKPTECKFVDFQLSRSAPPALDLATLIYINTTRAFRKIHFNEIVKIYSDTLESELRNAKIGEEILPRSEIVESLKYFHLAGLIEAALFSHLTLLPSSLSTSILSSSVEYDKFLNQSRIEMCLKAFEENYYRNRMTEILSEIIENFIISK